MNSSSQHHIYLNDPADFRTGLSANIPTGPGSLYASVPGPTYADEPVGDFFAVRVSEQVIAVRASTPLEAIFWATTGSGMPSSGPTSIHAKLTKRLNRTGSLARAHSASDRAWYAARGIDTSA